MNEYTVTYYDPFVTNDYITEGYITPELRNARIELLTVMGYTIISTHNSN